MTLYAITSGKGDICPVWNCHKELEYVPENDYRILALTASKEKAGKYKKLFSYCAYDVRIEEFEDMDEVEDSMLWRCDANGENPMFMRSGGKCEIEEHKGDIIWVYVVARDEKQAEKKAQDMIAEYKYRKKVEGQK